MVLASPPCSVSQRFPTVPTVPRYLSLSPRHSGRLLWATKKPLETASWWKPLYRRGKRQIQTALTCCFPRQQPECTREVNTCQSGGVKKVQRIHATIVKSITPIPINIPAASKVKIMVSIICFALL